MTSDTDRPPPRSNAAAIAVLTIVAVLALAVGLIAVVASDSGSGSAAASGDTVTVDVTLTEFAVDPASIDVAPGTEVIVNVTNDGEMEHDLQADGTTGTEMLAPGESVEGVSLGTFSESTVAWCTVPGHRESGMEMAINVTGEAHSGAEHAAAADTATTTGATIDPAAVPEADWEAFDPSLEPAPGATEHEITLHAVEAEVEVAPGVTQQAWTFVTDDGEPRMGGPVLRGNVGDLFTITLVNDGEVDPSIDFHASRVAWNDEMRSIGPGESLVYQYRAQYAGAYMYHCGTAPALHHIGNGMYGAIIIDPPNLPEVDREFVVVQSELYLGEQGQPGSLDKMLEADWDAVVFNGYYDQYKHAPIRVEADERIRVWVIDDGPSENSAFHIVGTIFDTVWKEGSYLLQPDERQGGSQVLDLQPAQGGFVEFSFAEEGFYPMVTHKFASAGDRAVGLSQAGGVSPARGAARERGGGPPL